MLEREYLDDKLNCQCMHGSSVYITQWSRFFSCLFLCEVSTITPLFYLFIYLFVINP